MTHTIPLPHTSPPLNLNDRAHWAVTAKKKRDLRTLIAIGARGIPRMERIAVTLVWQPRDRRRRDGDNPFPTIKSAVDGLVDAGIIPDDNHGRVTHRGVRFVDPEPGQKAGRLWLEVEEIA